MGHPRLAAAAAIALLAMATVSWASAPRFDPDVTELIVLFESDAELFIYPDDVLDIVALVNDPERPSLTSEDWSLYTRLGSPVGARWLVEPRLDSEYLTEIRTLDPDHPESRLQDFVVLRYSDTTSRSIARERLTADRSVASVVTNTKGTLSLRVNDYFVATTGHSQSPDWYQWALEDMKAMSPWNNTGAQSAWDGATGFGYVTIVDTGIMRIHPDLQLNFKPHFSQAFYSNGCASANSFL